MSAELLKIAESVAKAAGSHLMNRPATFTFTEKSSAVDFATQMDQQAEALIVKQILALRPDDGIIAEEGAAKESKSGITWVIDPLDGTVNGGGAFYNGEKIKCNEPVELSKALLATGFAYDLNLRISQGDTMAKLLPRIRDLRRNGAAAVDLCYVAMGALDGYFEASLKEWDHAAGGLIATEAGAVVSGPDGGAPSSELVVAAGPSLHAQLLPLI
ncbi:MAG: inositol monophosphatase [Actinobacteria bacterium]|nr:inositol monophosphatase [Actinomycetota bacterium]